MQPRQMIQRLMNNISTVIVGKQEVIEYALIALLCRGHVLIEDVPGVGKTTLASALAKSLDCTFRRIQFTPDLMPSDVTGYTLVNFKTGETEYREGSVMSQVVLADEINRTSPKTQSALLEVMEEQQVTVDGVTHPVPQPFIVLATQNPGEFVGTYPLPEAQMDRFFLRLSIGYPTIEQEMDVLERYSGVVKPMATLSPVCSAADVIAMQEMSRRFTARRRFARMWQPSPPPPVRMPPCSWVHPPAPPLPSSTGHRRARCSPGATTSCRRTCSTWQCKCLRTASCSAPKRA